jgi:transposase-like protein
MQPWLVVSMSSMSIDKKCLECGGELVRTYGCSENRELRPDIVNPVRRNNAKWRCGTCGHAFTTAQLRVSKRADLKVIEHAP